MRSAAACLIAVLLLAFAAAARAQEKTPADMAMLKAAAETGSAAAELAFAKALGGTPAGREWAQKAADQGLAEAWSYSAIMKREWLDLGTVTKESIRETQRKWLAYRDAWAAFAALRYPRRSADEWKAWMTTVRTAQLKASLQPL